MDFREDIDREAYILVVDDAPINITAIKHIFANQKILIRGVTSGKEALRLVKSHPPELILLDIVMPEMDGITVCEHLKNDSQIADIPVIFISGLGKPELIARGFQKGAVDFIVKPFNDEEIIARVATHLQMARMQRDMKLSNIGLENRYNLRTVELQQVNQKLKRSENQLRAILDNSQAVIYVKDVAGLYLLVNKEFESMYHVREEDIVGKSDYDLFPEKVADSRWANDWKALVAVNPLQVEESFWLYEQLHNYLSIKFPLWGDEDSPYGICNISTDISELKRTNEALEELNRNLEKKVELRTKELERSKERADTANRAKSNFLANMSHDIRTPMNAVLGFTEILRASETDDRKQHYLDIIHSSGNALLTLINDILDLSKIEAGKLDLQYSSVSVVDLVDEIKMLLMHTANEKGVELRIEKRGEIPQALLFDIVRLRQILINLVGNAIKFTVQGYVKVIVEMREKSEEDAEDLELVFTVEDSGIGIPSEQQTSIFQAFEQSAGQKMSHFGGTGLGLTISRKLIEMMNGTISLFSEVGKGSVFTVTFDDIERSPREEKEDIAPSLILNKFSFESATILVADDIDYNRELIKLYLEDADFTLLMANNGLEVLEILETKRIDLILLDMKMPEMDGYEVAQILNDDPQLSHIPVIAVTASALQSDEIVISRLCDSYLRKPLRQEELIYEVMKFLPHEIREGMMNQLKESNSDEVKRPAKDSIQTPLEKTLFQNQTILVVDDIEMNRELLRELLKKRSLHIIEAENGYDAIEITYKELPALILLDMHMPGIDGYETAAQIKADPLVKDIPIIAVTASSLKEDVDHALEYCDSLVTKPIDMSQLLRELKRFIAPQ